MDLAAAVDLDPAREEVREEKYDPNSQVERSKQTESDQQSSDDGSARGAVTVAQNLPNQAQQQASNAGKTTSATSHNRQTVNYEISALGRERVREPGEIRRLSVAVVVDGTTDANGKFLPRTKPELDRLAELVRSAVGFDAKRADTVTIDTMRFIAAALAALFPVLSAAAAGREAVELVATTLAEHESAAPIIAARPDMLAHLAAEPRITAHPGLTLRADTVFAPGAVEVTWRGGGLRHDPTDLLDQVLG